MDPESMETATTDLDAESAAATVLIQAGGDVEKGESIIELPSLQSSDSDFTLMYIRHKSR